MVDPMHNLFLGTSKKMIQVWKEKGFLSENKFQAIQDQVDAINTPNKIGRIPHKISAQLSGLPHITCDKSRCTSFVQNFRNCMYIRCRTIGFFLVLLI